MNGNPLRGERAFVTGGAIPKSTTDDEKITKTWGKNWSCAAVAYNELRGGLRQQSRRRRILRENLAHESDAEEPSEFFSLEEVQDDLLRMLFICCNDAMPLESQLVLSLKTLCGFDVREIAIRLFASEANIYKRLSPARDRLRLLAPQTEELTKERIEDREN